jgi:predicted AlkP superfamily phosphohydrolase/phosphomutase
MKSFHALVRCCWHIVSVPFVVGFCLGIIDNSVYLDPIPNRLLEKSIAVVYSSIVYGFSFAFLGLLLVLPCLIFWRRPLSDLRVQQKISLVLVVLLSAGFFFVAIGMWYYRDATFKVSLTEYIKVHEIMTIGLVSLAGGVIAGLCVRWFGPFLWSVKVPVTVVAFVASLSWLVFLVSPMSRDAISTESGPRQRFKVALIGIDAASWNLLLPWINQGELPHLRRLMEEGAWGVLRSRHPTRSPAIWTSVVTGKKRNRHGIYDFFREENGRRVPSASYHRQVKAIWNILSESKRKVWIIDWMTSYPPEKINGGMVTNLLENQAAPVYNQPDSVYPPELKPIIDSLAHRYRTRTVHPLTPASHDVQYAQLEQKYLRELEVVEEIGLYGCGQAWDLFALYTHSTDAVLHQFWKFMEPRRFPDPIYGLTPENVGRFGATALRHFQRTDQMLGRLLECVGKDTIVIVLSDHGQQGRTHKPDSDAADGEPATSGHHHNDGIVIMKGPGVRKGVVLAQKTVDTPLVEFGKLMNDKIAVLDVDRALRNLRVLDYLDILDITPTVLYLMGLQVADDMDGKVITQAIDGTYLAQNPIQYAKTYESEGSYVSVPQPFSMSKETEKRLRSLGYIQ